MGQPIIERLKIVFEDVFVDEYEILIETSADDIDEWDSMAQINLIKAIEEEFKIELDFTEVSEAANVGELIKIIDRKIK